MTTPEDAAGRAARSGTPWPAAAATGVGSMPGEDPAEALRVVWGELPDFPHLPELPGRGAGADMIGRASAVLVDLAVDLQPAGWRLVARPGADGRRARSMLMHDLDALEEVASGYAGPLKVQVAGPWTLAAALELPRGRRALADAGAVRDVTGSLAEGVRHHVREVRRRVPGAVPVLQLDEPSLAAVLAGAVPTPSGFGRIPAVPPSDATEVLRTVVEAAEAPVAVHCCAAGVPVGLLRAAGASAVSLDASLLRPADDEPLGEAVEAGLSLWLGLLPTVGDLPPVGATVGAAHRLWRRLGFSPESLASSVVVTPACGLGGASPAAARAALARAREAGGGLRDEWEGERG